MRRWRVPVKRIGKTSTFIEVVVEAEEAWAAEEMAVEMVQAEGPESSACTDYEPEAAQPLEE
jgi:hypothetical protein